jgi:hypothetical protein
MKHAGRIDDNELDYLLKYWRSPKSQVSYWIFKKWSCCT